MCDAEKDSAGTSAPSALPPGAINGCQKSPLDKPEMTFSFLIFKLRVTSFKGVFGPELNTICLLEHHLSIFVVSCSNLSEIRQCRMEFAFSSRVEGRG